MIEKTWYFWLKYAQKGKNLSKKKKQKGEYEFEIDIDWLF